MRLTDECKTFFDVEFGLSESDILAMTDAELRELREKCIDIEVDEAATRDITARGTAAAHCVDSFIWLIKRKRK